jgi:hypothetical protein
MLLIKKEIQKGIIPDPSIPVDPETGLATWINFKWIWVNQSWNQK